MCHQTPSGRSSCQPCTPSLAFLMDIVFRLSVFTASFGCWSICNHCCLDVYLNSTRGTPPRSLTKQQKKMAHEDWLKTLDRSKHEQAHSLRGKAEGSSSSNIIGLLKYKKFQQVLTLYGRMSFVSDLIF